MTGDLSVRFQPSNVNAAPLVDQVSGSSFWESIEGTLVLTETGSSYSGSFTFSGVSTPEGSQSVTVTGNFEGVTLNQ